MKRSLAWYYPDKDEVLSSNMINNRLFVFMPRNLNNSFDDKFSVVKYVALENRNQLENNNLMNLMLETLRSKFDSSAQYCKQSNNYALNADKNICYSTKQTNNLDVFLLDSNLYSNYAFHLVNKTLSDKPTSVIIDFKVI